MLGIKRGKMVLALVLCLFFMIGTIHLIPAKAYSDTEASLYGFSVDSDYYKKTVWNKQIKTEVKIDGEIVGVCLTDIGTTRAKEKSSDGQYMDHVLIRCTMKGKNPVNGLAGYAEHLTVQSTLPNGKDLVAYSPEQVATSTSYNVGVSASSDKTVGISAGTTFTKKALEINSYTDTSERLFKACFDYQHTILRPNWKLNKYSYNESTQRMHYVIKTSDSKYKTAIWVKAKFQKWSDSPGYWATEYNKYNTGSVIIYITSGY